MAIARSRGGLIGTNETTGLVTIANNATSTGSEKDLGSADDCLLRIRVYLCYDSSAAVGTIDVRINNRRDTTQAYVKPTFDISITPVNGTGNKIELGVFDVDRYVTGDIKNNAIGASLTNVGLLYTLEKVS